MTPYLSRPALRRVVQSLLSSEIHALRGKRSTVEGATESVNGWPDELKIGTAESSALRCDSLDILHLSAAVNEMFHLYEVGLETRLLEAQSFGLWLTTIEKAWERGVHRITLTTSGSSGIPKRFTHTFRHLAVEVDSLAEMFRDRSRILALVSAKHIYGLLFTALLPDRLGIPLVDLSSPSSVVRDQTSQTFQAGDLIVSVPDVWAWLNRSICDWEPDIAGVTSTAPCPRSTLEALSSKGLSRMVEVYGATETAGIGARVWPETFFSLMPHWTRDSEHEDVAKFVSKSSDFETLPMDNLHFSDERHFLVESRRDGAVQVGGRNVFLTLIEQRLVEHPEVLMAAVRLMRPDEGNRLKCFIVPGGDSRPEQLQERLEAFVATWPIPAERPKLFAFGSELPRTAQGKLCDW